MFREMRRNRQQLNAQQCEAIINRGSSGVLAVDGDGGYPYAVPLNYVYYSGKLYFHCAVSGHKLDAIKRNPRCSFCIIGSEQTVPEKFTVLYRSVIIFGKAAAVEDEAEKFAAVSALALKYSPDEPAESREAEIKGEWSRLCIVSLTPEHISGKQSIEYL